MIWIWPAPEGQDARIEPPCGATRRGALQSPWRGAQDSDWPTSCYDKSAARLFCCYFSVLFSSAYSFCNRSCLSCLSLVYCSACAPLIGTAPPRRVGASSGGDGEPAAGSFSCAKFATMPCRSRIEDSNSAVAAPVSGLPFAPCPAATAARSATAAAASSCSAALRAAATTLPPPLPPPPPTSLSASIPRTRCCRAPPPPAPVPELPEEEADGGGPRLLGLFGLNLRTPLPAAAAAMACSATESRENFSSNLRVRASVSAWVRWEHLLFPRATTNLSENNLPGAASL